MAFVMSSLQRPTPAYAMTHPRCAQVAATRVKKRHPKAKPTPAPAPAPDVLVAPAAKTLPDPAVLAPYVSSQGLGPIFAHPRLVPGMLKTKHALDLGAPTDQQHSGRCWIYASLNWLRQHVRHIYGKDFEYSQNYVAYWDKAERAATYFKRMMSDAAPEPGSRELGALNDLFTDGGTWEFFYNIVQKYGVVPNYAMPETRLAGQSQRYMTLLQRRVREIGGMLHERARAGAPASELSAIEAQGMQEVRRILDLCLGTPPASFLWRDPTDDKAPWVEMSPQAFLQQNPAQLDAMVFLTSYPQHPASTRLVFDDVTNVRGAPVSRALNVTMPVLKQAIRRSLRAGEAVFSMSDTVSLDEKHDLWSLNTDQSSGLLGTDATLRLGKGDRVRYNVNGATHAMMFSGCDGARPRKYAGAPLRGPDAELVEPLWQVENSWGGKPMYMTDRWVDAYVFGIVVNRDHLPAQARRQLSDETLAETHLPPWSPTRPMLA